MCFNVIFNQNSLCTDIQQAYMFVCYGVKILDETLKVNRITIGNFILRKPIQHVKNYIVYIFRIIIFAYIILFDENKFSSEKNKNIDYIR